MKTIPNYEVALSHLTNDVGQPVPIVALSFGWDDVSADPPQAWTQDNTTLTIREDGFAVELPGHSLHFPMPAEDLPLENLEQGVPLPYMMNLIQDNRGLFLCAYSPEGDLIAHIGFQVTHPAA